MIVRCDGFLLGGIGWEGYAGKLRHHILMQCVEADSSLWWFVVF
jgi:hypothetical protein